MQTDDNLKRLLEHLSNSLREAIRGSERVQELLREIEERGLTPSLTLGIVLARAETGARAEEIQETLIGPATSDRAVSIRRLSAFDRKFLRALRIQMTTAVPNAGPLVNGAYYTPADYTGGTDAFPAPAPEWSGLTSLSVFNGNPNGTFNLYVLDEFGALFHQEAIGEDERHLLVHLRRFLDSLGRRRSAQSTAAARRWLEGETAFHRLVRRGGGWHAAPVHVEAGAEHLDLVLIDDGPGTGFRLRCGDCELDSQVLGDAIHAAVVDEVVRHRRGHAAYPIYLTGVASAGLPDPGGGSPMVHG